jgi:hypothetical protein
MQNMIMINEFRQHRELIENRNGPVAAHSGTNASLKYVQNSHFLPYSMEVLLIEAQVKYMLKNRNKNN